MLLSPLQSLKQILFLRSPCVSLLIQHIDPAKDYHSLPTTDNNSPTIGESSSSTDQNITDDPQIPQHEQPTRPRRISTPNVRLQDALYEERGGPRVINSATTHNAPLHNDHESTYWMHQMTNTGQLLSPIFTDTTAAPYSINACTADTQASPFVGTPQTTETRKHWIQSIINDSFITPVNTKTHQSIPFRAHMMLQQDGSAYLHTESSPHKSIESILREYSRVIEDISIANHKSSQLQHTTTNRNLMQSNTFHQAHQTTTPQEHNTSIPNTPILHLPLTLDEALKGPDGQLWKEAWDQTRNKKHMGRLVTG